MADELDVKPDSSTGDEPQPGDAASSAVNQDVGSPGDERTEDRPVGNLKAEFDRKFTKVERQLQELTTLLVSKLSPPSDVSTGKKEPSDEELLDLVAQGHREALAMYIERQAQKKVQASMTQQTQTMAIAAAMGALLQRYPVFRDPSHPLTQYAMQVKQNLVNLGRGTGQDVDLEAMKTALVDNPALVAELIEKPAQAREVSRQAAVRAASGVEGSSHRRTVNPPAAAPVPEKVARLASRFGIANPAEAQNRFAERQKQGLSSVTPMIAIALKEEE